MNTSFSRNYAYSRGRAPLILGLAALFLMPVPPGAAQTTAPSAGANQTFSSVDLTSVRQAASAGDAAAQAELGSRYLNAKDMPRDFALGLAWSRKSADQGNARGQYLVGQCNANGWAMNRDQRQAGELGGIWATGDVDTNPPGIFWYAVLQSDANQGKNCGSAW